MTVGAVVAAAAAFSGAGSCGGGSVDPAFPAGPGDTVCYHLVRTLAERVGIATGFVTAILALTVAGLSRLVSQEGQGQVRDRSN